MPKFIVILFLLSASFAWSEPRLHIGLDFIGGFPQSGFRENVSRTGLGMNTQVLYRLSRSPFSIGASLGFLNYGSQSRNEVLSPNIPDVVVSVNTTNNILLTNFVLRYQPSLSQHRLRPYAEGLFGFNHLWTQTNVGGGSHQITSTNFSDSANSFGGGGGVALCLHRGKIIDDRIDLNLGVLYLVGGRADYLKEGSIKTEDDSVIYLVNRSRTNLLITNVGVSFSF